MLMRRSTKGIAVALTLCVITTSATAIFKIYGNAYEAPREPIFELRYETPTPIPMPVQTPAPTPDAAESITAASPVIIEPLKHAAAPPPAPPPDAPSAGETEEPYVEAVAIPDAEKTSLGIFTVTAYCSCAKCCGKWSGHELVVRTQAGFPHQVEGYTIAVDPKVIPLRSVVELDGYGTRYAHDTGGMIKGKRIDLFFTSHEEALKFGRQKLEVWIYK